MHYGKFDINKVYLFLTIFISIFSYLRLYGRDFSKEDHVIFIELFSNLMIMPEMGPSGVKGIAMLLQKLLKYVLKKLLKEK